MTIKEKIAHMKQPRTNRRENYYNLFGENFGSKLKDFDVELELLDSQMRQIGAKKEHVETDKFNLLAEFAKENSKYKVGHRFNERFHITDIVGEYVIDEIGVTDDGMELVYFLYDMNENFVGYFSKEQLDQMQND